MATYYKHDNDKKSGDGLAISEWNTLSSALAGNSGLHLALAEGDRIGIGTRNPATKLEIVGNIKANGNITLEPDNVISVNYSRFATQNRKFIDFQTNYKDDRQRGQVHLYAPSNYYTNIPAITLAGNYGAGGMVGIGTTSPGEALEVKGNVKAAKFIGDGSKLTNLRLGNASLEPDNIISVNYPDFATQNRKFIDFQTNYKGDKLRGQVHLYAPSNYYTNRPAITLAGNYGAGGMVGIGTTSPEDQLHVHGGLRLSRSDNHFRMYVESKKLIFKINESAHGKNKGISWDGDTNWGSSSDRRLKTNIVKEQDILPRLMQLDVKNYNWKDDPNRKLKLIGFMAQDVEPLFPSLVGEMEDEETKERTLTLKYASFGVLAVGAIKELKQEFDKKIAVLEKEIAELKQKEGRVGVFSSAS